MGFVHLTAAQSHSSGGWHDKEADPDWPGQA